MGHTIPKLASIRDANAHYRVLSAGNSERKFRVNRGPFLEVIFSPQ